jgi:protein-S-isoprenylcysteine O-methyltransferase Ste14
MNDTVWVTKLGLAVVAVVLVMVTSRYVSSVYSVGTRPHSLCRRGPYSILRSLGDAIETQERR